MTRSSFFVVIALLVGTGSASAQTIFFGDDNPRGTFTNSFAARNAFLAALTSWGTDDIESFNLFDPNPTLTFGATGITATTVVDFVGTEPSLAVSGQNFILDRGDGPDIFNLSSHVNAFGLFIVQAGDLANVTDIFIELEDTVANTSKTIQIGTFGPGRDFDSVFFFGVIDGSPFNRVSISDFDALGNDVTDGILFDDITVGFASVPEPSLLALFAAGAVGTHLLAQRRRKSKRSKV